MVSPGTFYRLDFFDLYWIETTNRFPEEFMIRLNKNEFDELVAKCDRFRR